jgi:hypothetical protein
VLLNNVIDTTHPRRRRLPDVKGSCEYIGLVVDSRQGVVLQLGGVRRGANNSSPLKKTAYYETLHRASELVGFCEHGNEPPSPIKDGEFLD